MPLESVDSFPTSAAAQVYARACVNRCFAPIAYPLSASFIHHVLGKDGDADAGSVAASTVRAVELLMNELRPLIGGLATLALYARSLHLASASFERPDPARREPQADFAALRSDLAARSPEDARRASQALLRAIVDLLVSLIGQSLTDRMLRTAWGTPNAPHFLEKE